MTAVELDIERLAAAIAEQLEEQVLEQQYSPATLAELLELSPRTVREMLARGDIASYTIGSARRVDGAEVRRFLRERQGGDDA